MYRLIAILLLFPLIQCSIDRTIIQISESEKQTLDEFQYLESKNKSYISHENEPGEKLLL